GSLFGRAISARGGPFVIGSTSAIRHFEISGGGWDALGGDRGGAHARCRWPCCSAERGQFVQRRSGAGDHGGPRRKCLGGDGIGRAEHPSRTEIPNANGPRWIAGEPDPLRICRSRWEHVGRDGWTGAGAVSKRRVQEFNDTRRTDERRDSRAGRGPRWQPARGNAGWARSNPRRQGFSDHVGRWAAG